MFTTFFEVYKALEELAQGNRTPNELIAFIESSRKMDDRLKADFGR